MKYLIVIFALFLFISRSYCEFNIFGKPLHAPCDIHRLITECASNLTCGIGHVIKTPNCVADFDMKCEEDNDCASLLFCLPNEDFWTKIFYKKTCQIPKRNLIE